VRSFLASRGGWLALAGVAAQLAAAHFVFHNQPDSVRAGLATNAFYQVAGFAWFGAAALVLLTGAWAGLKKPVAPKAGWLAAGLGLLAALSFTTFRDGLRDVTLLAKGYDVWERAVVTNWSVVALFLALFVIGLVTLGWLVSVMLRAKPVSEKVA
jgi:hypothetical protein